MRTAAVFQIVTAAAFATAQQCEFDAISSSQPPMALDRHGIGRHEAFHLDPILLHDRHQRHHRSRRDAKGARQADPLKISIQAHGKTIDLRLHAAENDIFAHGSVKAHTVSEGGVKTPIDIDTSVFYHGSILNEQHSRISMYIDRGILVGTVFLPHDEIYFERADKYGYNESHGFTNIIYKGSDMVERNSNGHGHSEGTCGNSTHYHKLKEQQRKIEAEREGSGDTIHQRGRRDWELATSGDTCEVKLIGDYYFWQSRGSNSQDATMEMVAMLDSASLIFRFTQFNPLNAPSPPPPGVAKLAVSEIEVYNTSANGLNTGSLSCAEAPSASCAQTFLDKLSVLGNFNQFCLVHAFTNLDFDGGILGLAWVGRPGSSGAGICATHSGGRSLNTGISTATNFGVTISWQVQVITLAHEFGHNFGSEHDTLGSSNVVSCAPNDQDGNYIMYLKATDGDKANNNKFSTCSIASISAVIRTNSDCFVNRNAFACGNALLTEGRCGNTILEYDEECECLDQSRTTEAFCDCATCTVTAGAQCSPAIDYHCCNNNGTLKGLSLQDTLDHYRAAYAGVVDGTYTDLNEGLATLMPNGVKCGAESDCSYDRYCINDARFVPFKGQIYGSCPNANLIVELREQESQQFRSVDDVEPCYNFTEEGTEPATTPSCDDLTIAWNENNATTNARGDCYLFHKGDTRTCQSTSLCRYNGCTGSVCDQFNTINADGTMGPGDEHSSQCSMSSDADACKVACRFASSTNTEKFGLCTVASPESVQADYGNNASISPGMIGGSLDDGRSCTYLGEAGGGKCNQGVCTPYDETLEDNINPEAIATWLEDNWLTVLIIVLVLIGIGIALKFTYHKNKKVIRKKMKKVGNQIKGKTMGPNAQREGSNAVKKAPSYQKGSARGAMMLTCDQRAEMRRKIRKEEQFLRLKAFFPKTDSKLLEKIQAHVVEEKDMIKRLLKRKEPLYVPKGNAKLIE